MEFGVVSRITDGYFKYQAWPTVAKDEKGVIYVGTSGHRLEHVCPFGKNYLYISRDDGKTWEGPKCRVSMPSPHGIRVHHTPQTHRSDAFTNHQDHRASVQSFDRSFIEQICCCF